jgi:hypothetical protein
MESTGEVRMAKEQPIYVSKPSAKSLWQEYRLYPDRLELEMHLYGPLSVPLKDISAISVRPALVIFDLVRGDYGLKDMLRTVKLDLADLNQHVTIEKETGFWRQFRLTPDDSEEFISAVEKARAALTGAPHGKQAVRES